MVPKPVWNTPLNRWLAAVFSKRYSVVGYDLRGRADDVFLSVAAKHDDTGTAPAAKISLVNLRYLLIDFTWTPLPAAETYVGDETWAFLDEGRLPDKREAERQLALDRIAGDLKARQWPVSKARQVLQDAARKAGFSRNIVQEIPTVVDRIYRTPHECSLCTRPGRFKIVSARICVGTTAHKLFYNAVTKGGQQMLVPPGFRWGGNLATAVQAEIEDPTRSGFALGILERQNGVPERPPGGLKRSATPAAGRPTRGPAMRPLPVAHVTTATLTPAGRGALAVVGVCGATAAEMVDRLFEPRSGQPVAGRADGTVAVGRWRTDAAAAGEEVVVVRRRCDLCEVHCHGGLAASAAVLESLEGLGAVPLSWPAWLAHTGVPEIEREAREALADAAGPQAARLLCRQLAGRLAAEFDRIGGLATTGDEPGLAAAARRLRRAARVGLRLTRPWRVVLAGRVNAGKSSLVNAIAGHARSLVSPRPGTTRDLVETRLVLGGWDIDLVDTAGLREPAAATERAGIARAMAARADADLVLDVVAADDPAGLAAAEIELHGGDGPPRLVVVTKCDLGPVVPPSGGVATSVVTDSGIETLATTIIDRLVPEARTEPDLLADAVPFTARQLAWLDELAVPVREAAVSRPTPSPALPAPRAPVSAP